MKRKLGLLAALGLGFLLGSKAGHEPYRKFMNGVRRLRETKVVSRPIENTAESVAGFVRGRGNAITDRAADAAYRAIVGNHPVVIEATITDVPSDKK